MPVNAGNDFFVIRLNPNGALDTTFGNSGVASEEVCIPNSGAPVVQPNGEIIVVGGLRDALYAKRYFGPKFRHRRRGQTRQRRGRRGRTPIRRQVPRRWLCWQGRRTHFALYLRLP